MLRYEDLPKIWERTYILLHKSSMPEWLTISELAKLTRNKHYPDAVLRRNLRFENIRYSKVSGFDFIWKLLKDHERKGFVESRERDNGRRGANPLEWSLTKHGERKAERIARRCYPKKKQREIILS